ncbi:MAG TPA: PQQ-dependent sugar dehydrogenase [Vicinamibacterales bacterium]|nr:PQQ-dependent sugar dehydrogenase [Vicinamibacterales bacterium]
MNRMQCWRPARVAREVCCAVLLVVTASGLAVAQPQVRAQLVASGLTHPLEFVHDPSNPAVQYIVEQEGRIRVLSNGTVLGPDFLNLTGAIAIGGEQGLLGLAFPPNYGASGRFYVFFTNTAGDLVVSRFRRSAGNPLVADAGSRLDLLWSTGRRWIDHPVNANHNGGHLAFGPDNYLYVAVGDGGGGGDPSNNAQNLDSLLGKLLRIDVGVDDSNASGFAVPPTNPFIGRGRPEIWDVGLRNPWKFSFDAATGAILIADVGQNQFEEIDYEPAGSGGRNYGWSLREGAHEFAPTKTPAFLPLDEPIFEYGRGDGQSVTGGFVNRGVALGPEFVGRYFFADFVTARVWSLALTPNGIGGVTAGDLRDHTADLGAIGNISSFGVDAAGDLYLVSWSLGRIFRLSATAPILTLDSVTSQPGSMEVAGWAIDRRAATGSGIDTVHVYAFAGLSTPSPPAPVFLGAFTAPFESRPDVAAVYGAQFESSGFHIRSSQFVVPGPVMIAAYARSVVTGQFEVVATRLTTVDTRVALFQDQTPTGTVRLPAAYSGWAIDTSVANAPPGYGTGISDIFVDVFSAATGQLVQVIGATYGLSRPDVGAIFGARFQNSGFSATLRDLAPGSYQLRIRYRLTANGQERSFTGSSFTVVPGLLLAVGVPAPGALVTPTFLIGGWTLDLAAATGTGVDQVHVWAYPNPGSGAPPVFLGAAQLGVARPDVAALFGSQFMNAGFHLLAGPLPSGTYDVVVFARSAATMTFDVHTVVRVMVQ